MEKRLYIYIFENSIHNTHPDYLDSLKTGRISLGNLKRLCQSAQLSYTLFFGSYSVVTELLKMETDKIFRGFNGKINIAIRGRVISLNNIRLIVKDIKNKQHFITRYTKVPLNSHIKYLSKSTRSLDDQAQCIIDRLGIDMDAFRSYKKKTDAIWYLISKLEENNIFISIEAPTSMPQSMKRANGLAGVYIRDKKFPFLFICNEGMAESEDMPGRKIFTIMYLTACLFKGGSKMMSYKDKVKEAPQDELFIITEKILMPQHLIPYQSTYTVEDLRSMSQSLNVTEMAILVRLWHLKYINDNAIFKSLYDELSKRYYINLDIQRKKYEEKQKKFMHNVPQNIIFYQGKAYLRILKSLYGNGQIQRREINRQLSYGRRNIDIEKVFDRL